MTGPARDAREAGDARSVSYLDGAFWQRFREADTPEAFASAWLALQLHGISGSQHGLVLLGSAGNMDVAAELPDHGDSSDDLLTAAEQACTERRGVVRMRRTGEGAAQESARYFLAYPFLIDGELHGAIAVETEAASKTELRSTPVSFKHKYATSAASPVP